MTAAPVRGREVTLDQVSALSVETEQNIKELNAKYQELSKNISTLQQTTARESKRLIELRALEQKANVELAEARKIQTETNARAAKADAEFAKADADHKAALERKKASNQRMIATIKQIGHALMEQGTIDGMVGGLTRMVFPHFDSGKAEERKASIGQARTYVEQNFGKELLDSFYEDKWKYFPEADKRCVNLSKKAVNDFVIPVLMSSKLPKNEEVTADLGGFKDKLSFDALIEIVKNAPKVTLIKVDAKFSESELNVLAQTVVEAKRKIPLVNFSDAAHQRQYEECFKGRLATTSKPLPPPPARRQ